MCGSGKGRKSGIQKRNRQPREVNREKTSPRLLQFPSNRYEFPRPIVEKGVNRHLWTKLLLRICFFNPVAPSPRIAPGWRGCSYVVSELSFVQLYDRRNDPSVPTEGYYAQLETRFGFATGDDSVSYLANQFSSAYYHKLTEKDHLAFGARIGSIIPQGESDLLPIDLRYFTGGSNSVRSFTERDLGVKSSRGVTLGGRSYFIANAEYIRTLASIVKGVVFFDAGGLSSDSSAFGFDDPRYAIGAGIRLDLPIGPVRFEYGHSLNPGKNEDNGAFHFAIGATF